MNQLRKLSQRSWTATQSIPMSPTPNGLIIKYLITTFSYGFYRNITSDTNPDELLINKFNTSLLNGIIYANPLTFPMVITRLLERIEIKLTKKDPEKHRESYREIYNYNYNTL